MLMLMIPAVLLRQEDEVFQGKPFSKQKNRNDLLTAVFVVEDSPNMQNKTEMCAHSGSTYTKIGTTQRISMAPAQG